MDGPSRLLGHRQDRPVAAGAVPGLEAGLSQDKPNPARIGATGAHRFSPPISGSSRHATAIAAGTARFGRHGGRSEPTASPEDHRDRHEDVPAVHTTDQIVSMVSRLGWTVGITADDLV